MSPVSKLPALTVSKGRSQCSVSLATFAIAEYLSQKISTWTCLCPPLVGVSTNCLRMSGLVFIDSRSDMRFLWPVLQTRRNWVSRYGLRRIRHLGSWWISELDQLINDARDRVGTCQGFPSCGIASSWRPLLMTGANLVRI